MSDARMRLLPAVGAVVVNAQRQILLVHKKWTNAWEFPRGKTRPGETDEETLVREIAEETGITHFNRAPGFAETIRFDYTRDGVRCRKTVRFFLIRTTEDVRLSNEHTEYRWCTIDDARKLLPHANEVEVLTRVTPHL